MTDYIMDLIKIMLTGIPIYILARIVNLRRRSRRLGRKSGRRSVQLEFNKLREICLGLFVLFMMALMTFVLQGDYGTPVEMVRLAKHRLNAWDGINTIPFRTIHNYYRVYGLYGDLFWVNVIGNVIMFMPWIFGLLLLWKKKRNVFKVIAYSAVLPIMIEFTQLFINRHVDVDDFILNFFGGILGGILFWGFAKLFPKGKNTAL